MTFLITPSFINDTNFPSNKTQTNRATCFVGSIYGIILLEGGNYMSKKKDNNKDSGYKNWLKESDLEDTEENRDWYNTPINKKYKCQYNFVQK